MSERLDSKTITELPTEAKTAEATPLSVPKTPENGHTGWASLSHLIEADIQSVEAHLHRMNGNGNGHKKPEVKRPPVEAMDMGMVYTVEEAIYTAEPENVQKTSDDLRWVLKQDITPEQYAIAKQEYLDIPQDRESLHSGLVFDSYLVFFMTLVASEARPSVAGSWKALDKALHKAEWYQEWFEEKYPEEKNWPPENRTQYSELKNAKINDLL